MSDCVYLGGGFAGEFVGLLEFEVEAFVFGFEFVVFNA